MRLLALALAGALLASACSRDADQSGSAGPVATGPTSASSSPAPSATSTSTPTGPFDEQAGVQIAVAAAAAMDHVTSLRLQLSVDGDNPTAVDVWADDTGACTGTVTIGDGRIRILGVADDQWFKADAAAWRRIAPDRSARLIRAAGDHWVKDEGFEVANFCFFRQLLTPMLSDLGSAAWFSAGADQIGGHDVVRLQSAGGRAGLVTAAVYVDEPHYLAEYERTDDTDGAVSTGRFSDYGAAVEVSAPAVGDVVDLSGELG